MGLAHELKIKTIEVQKRYIRKKLEECANSRDGRVMCIYYGEVYPEVRKYFENEGFHIFIWNNQKEPYAYVFTVDNTFPSILSVYEEAKAKEYADELEQKNKIKNDLDLL